MVRINGILFKSAEPFRQYLKLNECEWAVKAEINDLIRCAWPMLDFDELSEVLKAIDAGQEVKCRPDPPNAIYSALCACYGCQLPFTNQNKEKKKSEDSSTSECGLNKLVKRKKKNFVSNLRKEPKKMDELDALKNSLMEELAKVQDSSNYTTDGDIDQSKVEMLFKRAETVNSVAGKITEIHRLQLDSKRIKIEAVKIALEHGFAVDMNNSLGLEVKD